MQGIVGATELLRQQFGFNKWGQHPQDLPETIHEELFKSAHAESIAGKGSPPEVEQVKTKLHRAFYPDYQADETLDALLDRVGRDVSRLANWAKMAAARLHAEIEADKLAKAPRHKGNQAMQGLLGELLDIYEEFWSPKAQRSERDPAGVHPWAEWARQLTPSGRDRVRAA